jgi:hypothetical protein
LNARISINVLLSRQFKKSRLLRSIYILAAFGCKAFQKCF